MKSSLVFILLSPLLTTAQDSQEEELVITVGDLVQMFTEEEEGAAPVSRQPKQIVSQESVDFNAVVGRRAEARRVILVGNSLTPITMSCRRRGGEEMC